MTKAERSQILKMIADGKITAEEGMSLLRAMEEAPREEESATEQPAPSSLEGTTNRPEAESMPARLHETRRRWQRLFLWLGVGIVLLTSWGMYALLLAPPPAFWSYCLLAPFLLGVGVIALAANSRATRWLVVDIRQKSGAKPSRIFFGFPLPLKVLAWGVRTFGHDIPEAEKANMHAAVEVLESGLSDDEPLIIHADEDEVGPSVQVYLG